MPQTLWIGDIHFGNTDIPVKLHSAIKQERIQFHLLHKTDRMPLRQQFICALEKTPIPKEEQVKGFPLEDRKYVLIDPDELEKSAPEISRLIEVHEFVRSGDIDPVFMERAYFLEPGAAAGAYSSLAAAMKEMGVQGVATWVMRKRAYFGALTSTGTTLRLNAMRYADEIVQAKALSLGEFLVTEKELEIGSELINKLTAHFQPEKYRDEHTAKLRELIDKKTKGAKIKLVTPVRVKPTEPDKLLIALQKSLKKAA